MNLYEHTIIAKQDSSPAQLKQLTEKYSKLVENDKGDIVKTENWGLLNLSYIIKKNKKGNYIHFKIKGASKLIEKLEIEKEQLNAWLWVVDFPIFGLGPNGEMLANHHPFVMPVQEDAGFMEERPGSVRGLAYDLVYNGVEFGSGSIRNHDSNVQRTILRILGLNESEIDQKFGFLLNSLDAGAPPHGGIALGVDRIVAEFVGATSLRDVIAFPKTQKAQCLMTQSPNKVDAKQLKELNIKLKTSNIQQNND